jgi:hypothetical protein
MRHIKINFSLLIMLTVSLLPLSAQESAAPSVHLSYYFTSSDATLKMQKIKIVQSAYASYFEVNWFTNGYTGLQQTPDTRYGKSNILISSLWDANTAAGIYSNVDYNDPRTTKSRFGGEGDGWKTIHPYDWKLDTWYNLVNRAWKLNGRLYIGTFINDLSTGKWFHTATISIPFPQKYLNSYNDAFLENWDGRNAAWNGSFVRKAFFKDCWNLTTTGSWQKNTRAYFSANDSEGDRNRNGIYHNSFNAWYDDVENAYCMQHGGNSTPSAAFAGGRTLNLPAQSNQGTAPAINTISISSFEISYQSGILETAWSVDDSTSPQLSAKIDLLDARGKVVLTVQDTLPQRRRFTIEEDLNLGEYTVRLRIRDIFNQLSIPATGSFIVQGTPSLSLSVNELTIASLPGSKGTFDVASNLLWATSSDQSWLSVSHTEGSGNASVSLTAEANPGSEPRMAIITVSGPGVSDQTLMVTQDGNSTGLSEIIIEEIRIYPNPVHDFLRFNRDINGTISVFDLSGNKVISQQINGNQVDIHKIEVGVYFIKVDTGIEILVKKFLKQ